MRPTAPLPRFSLPFLLAAAFLAALAPAGAESFNGNDFALDFSEATHDARRRELMEGAGRRPHYFRYLQIMEMEEGETRGRPWVRIIALEPSSLYDVVFEINQPVSLTKLREEPASVRGKAVAVSGVIVKADPESRAIHLNPTVLRHKDRLAPVSGKEMLYELDDRHTFYSFTGGREAVKLSYRDRDLLRHRDRIIKEGGDQAWADFLQREIRRREAARKAGEPVP